MKTITLKDFVAHPVPKPQAFLWTHIGEGTLYAVVGVDRDWWVSTTQSQSFSCTPQEELYIFDTQAEKESFLREMQSKLKEVRESF